MTQERCAQLKYDKSKPPKLEAQPKVFDCVRVRCPWNKEGKFCNNTGAWYTCQRQIEP